MDDRNTSPDRRPYRHAAKEVGGGRLACTGKSCQSCMAGAIADCVALCCCPCAVLNCFVLAFFKMPWAVARRCIRRSRRRVVEERKCEWTDGGMFEIMVSAAAGEGVEEYISAEELWFELAEVGHLGFGRVSSARIN